MDANPRQLSQHCLSTLKVLSMPPELNMKGLHLRFEMSIWLRWPLMPNSGQLSSYHLPSKPLSKYFSWNWHFALSSSKSSFECNEMHAADAAAAVGKKPLMETQLQRTISIENLDSFALDDTSKGAMISTIEASHFILNEPSAEETIMKSAMIFKLDLSKSNITSN